MKWCLSSIYEKIKLESCQDYSRQVTPLGHPVCFISIHQLYVYIEKTKLELENKNNSKNKKKKRRNYNKKNTQIQFHFEYSSSSTQFSFIIVLLRCDRILTIQIYTFLSFYSLSIYTIHKQQCFFLDILFIEHRIHLYIYRKKYYIKKKIWLF